MPLRSNTQIKNWVNCWELSLRQSAAKPREGKVQRLSARSRVKRPEAPSPVRGDDIVSSVRRRAAAKNGGIGIAILSEDLCEQRRDIEKSLFKNEARSGSDPRKAGKLISWITNVSISATGTPSAAATGDGTDTASFTGTDRALALSQIDAVMQACYEDGGNPSMLVVSPANKVAFSGLSSGSVATNQITMTANAPKEAAIIGSVALYLSDFGTLNVTIDRQLGNGTVFLLDPDFYSIGHLPGRMFSSTEVAPTGDAKKFAIVSEWTLIVKAPKAHGYVGDLTGA